MSEKTDGDNRVDAGGAGKPAAAAAAALSDADVRHNVKVNVLLDAIYTLGATDFALVAGPLYVYLKASNTVIGMINALAILALFGVVLSPYISTRFAYKKKYLFVVHLPYIGAYGLIGLGVIFSQNLGWSNAQLLNFVFAMMALNLLASGFVTLPHQEFLASCIPMRYRGRYTGFSMGLGSAGSIISSTVGGFLLYYLTKPAAFGWLYIMMWVFCQAGYVMCLFARERRTPVENAPTPWTKRMFQALWADKAFLRVVMLNFLFFTLINPAFTFIPIYGYRDLNMIPATAATILIVQQIVRALLASHVGILTDKFSPKRVFPFCLVAAALAFVPLLVVKNAYGVYISSGLSALCLVGAMASFNALIFGVPAPENRSGHFTIQILFRNLSEFAGMLAMGVLCDRLGYLPVFALWIPLSLAFGLMAWKLLAPLSAKANDYA
jgi:MFS family permease